MAAFDELVRPLLSELTYAARAMTPQEADALDLLQETLARAFRGFATFKQGSNVKAWLYTIMRNASIDRARRRKLEPVTFDEEPTAASVPASLDDLPWDELVSDEMLAALQKLSPRHRLLVFLCDIEGLSYKEIAEALGIPIGTVMSGLHGARTKLRATLLAARRIKQV